MVLDDVSVQPFTGVFKFILIYHKINCGVHAAKSVVYVLSKWLVRVGDESVSSNAGFPCVVDGIFDWACGHLIIEFTF
jgi:hypothetical protein